MSLISTTHRDRSSQFPALRNRRRTRRADALRKDTRTRRLLLEPLEDRRLLANLPPIADAGGPYFVAPAADYLRLDGSQSYDPDEPLDAIVEYAWELTADGSAEIYGQIGFVAVSQLQTLGLTPSTDLAVRLVAKDAQGASSHQTTTISIDDAPTEILLSAATLSENLPAGTTVGTLSTSDPDVGDRFSYALAPGEGDADNGSFVIPAGTSELRTAASFDFETKSCYNIRVRSTDSGGLAVEQQFTITVTNAEPPFPIAFDPSDYDGQYYLIGDGTHLEGPAVRELAPGTYSLVVCGVGSLKFDVDDEGNVTSQNTAAASGLGNVLQFNTASVMIDPAGYTGNYDIALGEISPFGNGSRSIVAVKGMDGYTVRVYGVDSFTFNVDAAGNVISQDPIVATGVGSTLQFNTTTVAIDPAGYTGNYDVVLGQVAPFGNGSRSVVAIKGMDGYAVRIYSVDTFAFNVDPAGNVTSQDPAAATGAGNTLRFNTTTVTIDPSDYRGYYDVALGQAATVGSGVRDVVAVRGMDGYALRLYGISTFVFNVDAVGNVTSQDSTVATGIGATLRFNTTRVSIDPGLFAGRYHVGTYGDIAPSDTGMRNIALVRGVQGYPLYATEFGFSFSFGVDADGQPDPSTATVAINETPYTFLLTKVLNEAPTGLLLSAAAVGETAPVGTQVGTLSTSDPDVGDTFSYALVPGEGDADNASFVIPAGTSELRTAASFDFETKSSYSIRVRSTDAGGLAIEKQFTITVTDVHAQGPFDVQIDPSGYMGQYTVSGHGNFLAGPSTCLLAEGAYSLALNGLGTLPFSVDDDGDVTSSSPAVVAGPDGSLRFNTTTIHVDPSTYSGSYDIPWIGMPAAVAGPNDPVVVAGLTHNYTLRLAAGPSFVFSVDATGQPSPSTATVTVSGIPYTFFLTGGVNVAPGFTASDPPIVDEDAGPQTIAGWATFSPGPPSESSQTVLRYVVEEISNRWLFSAEPTVATDGTLTYTPAPDAFGVATFAVAVQDNGGTAYGGVDTSPTQTFAITINAVNDTPSVTANSIAVVVDEGVTAQNMGTFFDVDLSNQVTLRASIGTISQSEGASGPWSWWLTTSDGPAESQVVTITADDGQGGVATTTFNLTVNNVAPIVDDLLLSVPENTPGATVVGRVLATDFGSDTWTYQVVGGNGASAFEIDANTGKISVSDASQLDFETLPSWTLEVQATDDDQGISNTARVTINLVNQPSITGSVFVDADQDGLYDANEPAVDAALIELLDAEGNRLASTTTSGGFYLFEDLDPGTYLIREVQPTGVADGAELLGTLDGTIVANDVMRITLERTDAHDYCFAELGQQITSGDAASIGFWQNKHGQELINAGGAALANWLSSNFSNVFGSVFDSMSVAEFYRDELFKQKSTKSAGPAKVDAQFMAVALATYFTSNHLAGNVAAAYGFNVTDTGIGTKIVNVGSRGAAFGTTNGANLTVMQLLQGTNELTDQPDEILGAAKIYDINGDGVIDAYEASLRVMANDLYSAINDGGGI